VKSYATNLKTHKAVTLLLIFCIMLEHSIDDLTHLIAYKGLDRPKYIVSIVAWFANHCSSIKYFSWLETTDVDECTGGTDRCHLHATCTNTQGSYTCSCNNGSDTQGMGFLAW